MHRRNVGQCLTRFIMTCTDSHIWVNDVKKNFDIIKVIRCRDVGWSVLDVAFRSVFLVVCVLFVCSPHLFVYLNVFLIMVEKPKIGL